MQRRQLHQQRVHEYQRVQAIQQVQRQEQQQQEQEQERGEEEEEQQQDIDCWDNSGWDGRSQPRQ